MIRLEKRHWSFSSLSASYLEEIPLKIKEAQNSTFHAAILKLYLAARAYVHVCDVISLTQNWQEAEKRATDILAPSQAH